VRAAVRAALCAALCAACGGGRPAPPLAAVASSPAPPPAPPPCPPPLSAAVRGALTEALGLPPPAAGRGGRGWRVAQAGEVWSAAGRWGWRWLSPPPEGAPAAPRPAPPAGACAHRLTLRPPPGGGDAGAPLWALERWSAPPAALEALGAGRAHPRYPTQLHALMVSGAVHAAAPAPALRAAGLRPPLTPSAEGALARALARVPGGVGGVAGAGRGGCPLGEALALDSGGCPPLVGVVRGLEGVEGGRAGR